MIETIVDGVYEDENGNIWYEGEQVSFEGNVA